MAAEKKDKKRKAASSSAAAATSEQPPKKSKKSLSKVTTNPPAGESKAAKSKSKDLKELVNTRGNGTPAILAEKQPARVTKPRKRAADFLSDDEDDDDAEDGTNTGVTDDTSKPATKKAAKAAAAKSAPQDDLKQEKKKLKAGDSESKGKKAKKAQTISKSPLKEAAFPSDSEDESAASAADGDEDDDQTAALIKGFESSGDEDDSEDEGYVPGQEVPAIPDSKQVKRKMRKQKKRGSNAAGEEEAEQPGVVYVGRVPHGFYEHEMRAYFSQFGTITRLRLSRNRTTGRSKHYAFLEFASGSVARIVADTMDNYLMFGHILKCRLIPADRVHSALWKGANRRFKKTPWNQIEKRSMEAPKSRAQWDKRLEKEAAKRAAKREKMKQLGYEVDLPKLKGVGEVPVREEEEEADEQKAIEAQVSKDEEAVTEGGEAAEEKVNSKKGGKKGEKSSTIQDSNDKEGTAGKKSQKVEKKDKPAVKGKEEQKEKKKEQKSKKTKSAKA